MLIRSATSEDALAVARVHVRSWQEAYRGLLSDDYLDRLRAEERAQRYQFGATDPSRPSTIVAAQGSAIVGFATVVPARDPDARGKGELCALYVDPDQWGKGIGRALIEEARLRLGKLGCRDAILWVLAGNTRAERFYVRDGWCPDGQRRTMSIWGVTVEEIRYQRQLAPPDLSTTG